MPHAKRTSRSIIESKTVEARKSQASGLVIGPGCFESSWDLHRGLDVTEEGRVDGALRTWIADFLCAPVAQPRPARVASPSAITAIA